MEALYLALKSKANDRPRFARSASQLFCGAPIFVLVLVIETEIETRLSGFEDRTKGFRYEPSLPRPRRDIMSARTNTHHRVFPLAPASGRWSDEGAASFFQ